MPDQDTTIANGDPGHALLHQDANTEINSLRARAATLETTVGGHTSTLEQKYTVPANSSVTLTDGTVTRVVKLTQAAYDALGTKVATTLYVISG